jgi:UDP-glucose 4-epimerase
MRGMFESALVTGGTGFIGSHLVKLLLEKDMKTRVLSHSEEDHGIIVKGDLTNLDDVLRLTENVDVVFHLARGNGNTENILDVNIKGTWNLKQACTKNKVRRILFASTSHVYGQPERLPVNENAALRPRGPYAQSKVAAEMILQARDPDDIAYTILRVFNVYGPKARINESHETDKSHETAIPTYIRTSLNGENIVVHGDGTQRLDFVDVRDVACAFVDCLDDRAENQVFNVGSGKAVSMNALADEIKCLTGNSKPTRHDLKKKVDIHHAEADIRKIRDYVRWRPKHELDDGLKETVDSMKCRRSD